MSASAKPRLAGRQPSCDGGVPRVRTGPVGGRPASVEPRSNHHDEHLALPTTRRPAPGDQRGLSVRTRSLTSPYARSAAVIDAAHSERDALACPATHQIRLHPAHARPAPRHNLVEIATRLAEQTELWEPLVALRPDLPLLRPAGQRAGLRGLAAHLGARPGHRLARPRRQRRSVRGGPRRAHRTPRHGQPARRRRRSSRATGAQRGLAARLRHQAHPPGDQPRARAGGQRARLLPRAGGDDHATPRTARELWQISSQLVGVDW